MRTILTLYKTVIMFKSTVTALLSLTIAFSAIASPLPISTTAAIVRREASEPVQRVRWTKLQANQLF